MTVVVAKAEEAIIQTGCLPEFVYQPALPRCIPPGGHHSPAVGRVFLRGVHVLFRRNAAPVGRSHRQHGVQVPRPPCRALRLHHQQVGESVLSFNTPSPSLIF